MACDIHIMLEAQQRDGSWVHLATVHGTDPLRDRYYALFGRLADVRRPDVIGPLFRRGLPVDFDRETLAVAQYDEESIGPLDHGAHGHGWATICELAAADWSELDYVPFVAWVRSLSDCAPLLQDRLRVVFWFDN